MLAILLEQATNKIKSATNLANLEQARIEILGKNGTLSLEMRTLGTLAPEEKKTYGQELNQVKTQIETLFEERKNSLQEAALETKLANEKLDISLPGRVRNLGSIHPISQAQMELTEIFARLGFKVEEGPNIETDWYNFTALNIAENHPARQMHDTFYLPDHEGQKLVLRTHTSPVQIRTMLENKPPLRFITPGRTYRSDYDQTHTPMFHQIEGLALDKDINMGHMKFVIIEFINTFFEGQKVDVRFRPSFFPFTEPSAEVDIKFSDKPDAKWLEVLGCGMIHPNVLRNCNIDSNEYQGFAFGLGLERMAMLKYGINDLRQFFESDIRWLKHYSFSSFDIPSLVGGLTR